MSEPRENLVAQKLLDDKIVVSSGWNGHASSSKVDIFKYNKNTDSITRLDSLIDQPGALNEEEKRMLKNMTDLEIKRNRPTSVGI